MLCLENSEALKMCDLIALMDSVLLRCNVLCLA